MKLNNCSILDKNKTLFFSQGHPECLFRMFKFPVKFVPDTSCLGVKLHYCKSAHLLSFLAKATKTWMYTSSPLCVFIIGYWKRLGSTLTFEKIYSFSCKFIKRWIYTNLYRIYFYNNVLNKDGKSFNFCKMYCHVVQNYECSTFYPF